MDPNNTSIEKIKRRIERIQKRNLSALGETDRKNLARIYAAAKKPSPEDVRWVEALALTVGA